MPSPITVAEAAILVGKSISSLRKSCQRGSFAAEKHGREWLIDPAAIRAHCAPKKLSKPPKPSSPKRATRADSPISFSNLSPVRCKPVHDCQYDQQGNIVTVSISCAITFRQPGCSNIRMLWPLPKPPPLSSNHLYHVTAAIGGFKGRPFISIVKIVNQQSGEVVAELEESC